MLELQFLHRTSLRQSPNRFPSFFFQLMKLVAAESKLRAIVAAERQLRASKLELSSANKAMCNAEADLRSKRNPIFSAAATVEFMQVTRIYTDIVLVIYIRRGKSAIREIVACLCARGRNGDARQVCSTGAANCPQRRARRHASNVMFCGPTRTMSVPLEFLLRHTQFGARWPLHCR